MGKKVCGCLSDANRNKAAAMSSRAMHLVVFGLDHKEFLFPAQVASA